MGCYTCYTYKYLLPGNIFFSQREHHIRIFKMLYIPLLFRSENDVLWKIMLDDAKSDAVQ